MVEKKDIRLDDVDYSDLEAKYDLGAEIDEKLECLVVVDQIPKVDSTKKPRFVRKFKETFCKDLDIDDDAIFIPDCPDSEMGNEFMFIELQNPRQAEQVLSQVNGAEILQNRALSAFASTKFQIGLGPEPAFELEKYREKEWLKEWLMDSRSRDQFSLVRNDEYSLHWWDGQIKGSELAGASRMSGEGLWSNTGVFWTVLDRQQIILFGGSHMSEYQRIEHKGVLSIAFSPQDNFLVTFGSPDEKECCLWNVHTGVRLGKFSLQGSERPVAWSFDEEHIVVYDGSLNCFRVEFDSLTKVASQSTAGVPQNICCPSNQGQWIAFWYPGHQNTPAKICIYQLPLLNPAKIKPVFNLTSCSLYWHGQGKYLAACIERVNKKKTSYSIEVFFLGQDGIPTQIVDLGGQVRSFSWTPNRDVCSCAQSRNGRTVFCFYDLEGSESEASDMDQIGTIEHDCLDQILWSPNGEFFVLSGLGRGQAEGQLEFYYLNGKEFCIMGTGEHYMATRCEWNQSGQYLATFESSVGKSDGHYIIWDFKGLAMVKESVNRLDRFLWRPKPPYFLTQEKIQDIVAHLDRYEQFFDGQDEAASKESQDQDRLTTIRLRQDWDEWRTRRIGDWGLDDTQRNKVWIEKAIRVGN